MVPRAHSAVVEVDAAAQSGGCRAPGGVRGSAPTHALIGSSAGRGTVLRPQFLKALIRRGGVRPGAGARNPARHGEFARLRFNQCPQIGSRRDRGSGLLEDQSAFGSQVCSAGVSRRVGPCGQRSKAQQASQQDGSHGEISVPQGRRARLRPRSRWRLRTASRPTPQGQQTLAGWGPRRGAAGWWFRAPDGCRPSQVVTERHGALARPP